MLVLSGERPILASNQCTLLLVPLAAAIRVGQLQMRCAHSTTHQISYQNISAIFLRRRLFFPYLFADFFFFFAFVRRACARVCVCVSVRRWAYVGVYTKSVFGVRQRHIAHPYVQLNVSRYCTGICVKSYRLWCVDTLSQCSVGAAAGNTINVSHSLCGFLCLLRSFFPLRHASHFFIFFIFNDSPMCVEQLHFGNIEWVFSLVGRVHSIRHSFLKDDYSASSINCVYSFISIQSTKALKIIFEQPPQNRLKNKFGVLRQEIQCHSKNYCKCERDLSNINFHVLSIKFTNHK